MVFAYPCFSGECGFCASCCQRCFEKVEDREGPEILRRADDLSTFLGKKRVDDIMMDYNSQLKGWCKSRGYRNPRDIGSTNPTLRITRKGRESLIFRLIRKSHGAICDDSWCKVGYVNSTEWIHTTTYTNLPIYEGPTGIHFCGPCITRKYQAPEISSL